MLFWDIGNGRTDEQTNELTFVLLESLLRTENEVLNALATLNFDV